MLYLKKDIDMLHGPIFRNMSLVALPLIATNLLQLLFNTADVVVIGRYGNGSNALAAVGVAGLAVHTFIAFITNFSVGATYVAAMAIGTRDSASLRRVLHSTMGFAMAGGMALMLLMVLIMKPLLVLLQTPEEIFGDAMRYLWFCLPSIPACAIYNFGAALLRARGDTQRPFYILTASGIINVVLNLFFVLALKMNVAGVALATTIAFYLSAVAMLYLLGHEEGDWHLNWRRLSLRSNSLGMMVSAGLPAAVQAMFFHTANLIVQGAVNTFGAAAIAGTTASANIGEYLWTSMNGFAQTSMSFSAQNHGAKNYARIWQVCWRAMFMVFTLGVFQGLLCIAFGRDLLGIYTSDTEAIQAGLHRLHFICGFYALCGVMDTLSYIIRGMGYSLLPTVTTVIGALGVRVLWILTIFQLPRFHSLFWLYMTYPISWIVAIVVHSIALTILLRNKIPRKST